MTRRMLIAALFAVSVVACFEGPRVTQGTVVRVDAAERVLVVRDEREPHEEIAFSFAGAEVGADPSVGDVVRLAWKERDGRNVASRVMNLTRQDEVKGGKK